MKLPAPFRLALPAYLVLLIVLTIMGATNQGLLNHQVDLMDQKTQLSASVARARLAANAIVGPQAVATWAYAAGLVPVPEGGLAVLAAADNPPPPTLPAPSLEVSTIWR